MAQLPNMNWMGDQPTGSAYDVYQYYLGGGSPGGTPAGGGGGGGITPDPNIVAASAFNRGTGNEQVNQLTGLTYVEESLLKPWEKALRIQQRQKRT